MCRRWEANVSFQAQRGHPTPLSFGGGSGRGHADSRLWRLGFFDSRLLETSCLSLSPEKIHGGRETLGGCPEELVAPWVQHKVVFSSQLIPENSQKAQVWLGLPFSEHQVMLFPPGIRGHIVPITALCCSYKPSKVLSPCLVHALSLIWPCLSSSPSLSNTTWQTPTYPLWHSKSPPPRSCP